MRKQSGIAKRRLDLYWREQEHVCWRPSKALPTYLIMTFRPFLLAIIVLVSLTQVRAAVPTAEEAKRAFAEAQEYSKRDGGELWGMPLYGPMLFVDPESNSFVANENAAQGGLKEGNGVFTGKIPAEISVANTSLEYLGTRWTEILWPLPGEADERHVKMMHELFHRIQPALGFGNIHEVANAQLDTLEGRYLLRLEWLALTKALQATDDATCKRAISDALTFRARRQALFPDAHAQETELEENEGVAEYTGVRLGIPDSAERRAHYTVEEIGRIEKLGSYVRAFAYATGPAYGLLLDRYDRGPDTARESAASSPTWVKEVKATPDFAKLLTARAGITLPKDLAAAVIARANNPESRRIRQEEEAHEAQRQQLLAADRKRFVEGPVLRIALKHMNVQFNPSRMRSLDKLGTVSPTMRLSDDWGILEVTEGGALLSAGWDQVIVPAPAIVSPGGTKLSGPGWTMELKAGWKLTNDQRKGDYRLQGP